MHAPSFIYGCTPGAYRSSYRQSLAWDSDLGALAGESHLELIGWLNERTWGVRRGEKPRVFLDRI